jgi:hypothetical protein
MWNKCFVRDVFVRSLQKKETYIMKATDCNFHCEYYPHDSAIRLKMCEIKQRKVCIIHYVFRVCGSVHLQIYK